MYAHVCDVALCGNTIKKCGSWSLTGWPPLVYLVHLLIMFEKLLMM